MFIVPTITLVPSGFSGYIWLDTKIVFKKGIPIQIKVNTDINIVDWSRHACRSGASASPAV